MDLGVESILRNDDGDDIDKRNKIKLVMKEKLWVPFTTKVQDKDTLPEKCNYSTIIGVLRLYVSILL